MKKRHLLSALILLLAVGGTLAWRYWPRTVPPEECSELYRRYCDNPHVAATFLKDFQVNDSVVVDVTFLEALTSNGWDIINKDFNIKPIPEELMSEVLSGSIKFWFAPRKDYKLSKDSVLLNNDVLLLSYGKKELCIFNIKTEKQVDAIINYQLTNIQTK